MNRWQLLQRGLGLTAALLLTLWTLPAAHAALGPDGNTATASDYEASPPLVVEGANPLLMINLSVELTQQAEGFTDAKDVAADGTVTCPDRINSLSTPWGNKQTGICYSNSRFIGYFDPDKCYTYDTSGDNVTNIKQRATGPYTSTGAHYFKPVGAADSNRQCNGNQFSGNFLNWATMTALDEFRATMTGGARLVDTAGANANTLLVRTYRYGGTAHWNFELKAIGSGDGALSNGGVTFSTGTSKVTPWNKERIYVVNDWNQIGGSGDVGAQVRFYDSSGNPLSFGGDSTFNVAVKVCDSSIGLESSCVKYSDGTSTWYKPEGLLQKNALKMRYALSSYTARSGNAINGGVLRANAKYIGYLRPTSNGGFEVNPNAEIDASGLYVFDPDKLAGKTGINNVQPVNSGIINYINQFALYAGAYKINDPDAELYYEGLRYLMHLGPTTSFFKPYTQNGGPLSAAEQDGYPIFGGGNDGSPGWSDPIANSCQKNYTLYVGDKNTHRNDYIPGGTSLASDDPTCFDQNTYNTWDSNECKDAFGKGINATTLENDIGGVEGGGATTNYGNNHGDGLAALAWWAHTHDIRTDITGTQKVKTFVVDTQEYGAAHPVGSTNTLWIAAKWGGFEDSNNDKFGVSQVPSPDLLSEWNARGATFYDGTKLPDTYTLASKPDNMVAGLTSAFGQVLEHTSSSSAAALVANSSSGVGAVYQALYEPKLSNNTEAVTWTGLLRAFFVDSSGRVREDSNHNAQLDAGDDVVLFRQDAVQKVTVADRYDTSGNLLQQGLDVRELTPIWNAGDQLSALTDSQVTAQRTYTDPADTGRYIFTWLDLNNNGAVDSGEVKDFTAANFPAIDATNNNSAVDPARFLGLDSATGSIAGNLVNYIRGEDRTGWRNRTIDLTGSGVETTQRLGDIVHSAPLVVGAPSDNYDLLYGDDSYAAFKSHYLNRRQVIYAGANDGMLHAFNGGFFNAVVDGSGNVTYGFTTSKNGEVAHPLGSELWAYVPYDLLPHLQWLKDPSYAHTYYVDGTPQAFDVNIFSANTDHPYGWGTILVVGFRMGGGDITVNATTDMTSATDPGNRTLRPAYLIFDITNPEVAPTLIAEISNPKLGYTVGMPVTVKRRVDTLGSYQTPAANQWYLIMGSGPRGSTTDAQQVHDDVISTQQAGIFVYNLNTRTLVDGDSGSAGIDPFPIAGQTNAFVGDITAKDWNLDYSDEVVYFGTVGNTVADPRGNLMRMQLPADYSFGTPTFSSLLTNNGTGQPFSTRPLAVRDVSGQPWVYAGTGRFYSTSDISSAKQMTYYGIKEPTSSGSLTFGSVDKTDLVDTTGIQIYGDGTATDSSGNTPFTLDSTSIGTFQDLAQLIAGKGGWYFDFSGPSARDVDITEQFYDTLLITEYTASNDSCDPLGSSRRYAPNMLTGTASVYAPLGTDSTRLMNGSELSLLTKDLGFGQAYSSGIIHLQDGAIDVTAIQSGLQQSGLSGPGATNGRMSWREVPIQ